mmetsp:Transcript_31079/g.69011  ORF Transcript_31079/g.69011 Transcript_31079/m.69011 type:complete len:201 (+) Transcript_31079:146-748(+)
MIASTLRTALPCAGQGFRSNAKATAQGCICITYRRSGRSTLCAAQNETPAVDIKKLSEVIATQPIDDEQRYSLERLAQVFQVPLGTVKNMTFKRRGLLNMDPAEVRTKIETIARVVEVPYDKAREMVVIQPGLLFDTDKQADVLAYGIRAICYELNAPKEEVVELILKNQSVLHGRELHLSVADMAHLAMLREPRGRIVD